MNPHSTRLLPAGVASLWLCSAFTSSVVAQDAHRGALSAPRFIENRGQWDSPEQFRVRAGGLDVFLEQNGWSVQVTEDAPNAVPAGARSRGRSGFDRPRAVGRSTALKMSFVGGDADALIAEAPLAVQTNYYVGADPASHRQGVPSFASVRFPDLYPGIDVRTRTADGRFEYDLLVAPGAELAQAELRVDGALGLRLNTAGDLVVKTALGDIVQTRPTTWMVDDDGARVPLACDYELVDQQRFRFVAPDRDLTRPLVVDPPLLYSGFVGGGGDEYPRLVTQDAQGRILMCGETQSINFPTTLGGLQPAIAGGLSDGFIVCVDPTLPAASQVVFSTYFGGNAIDVVNSIAPLATGDIVFAGATQSVGLPTTTGAIQPTHAGGTWDGFIGVLDSTGTTLRALTYHGGSGFDAVNSVHEHPSGLIAFSGVTRSTDLPVTAGAYQSTHAGGPTVFQDGCFGVVDAAMNLLFNSSYFGGTGDEWLYLGELDSSGVMGLFGSTSSTDIPTTANAYQPAHAGGISPYWWSAESLVVLIDPFLAGPQQLLYASYLGGSGQDSPQRLRFASNGDLVVCGVVQSSDFPTTAEAFQPRIRGGGFVNANYVAGDAFVARLDPNTAGAAGMVYGTYYGGVGQDQGLDCDLDSDDVVTIVGWTQSTSNGTLPTTPNALRRAHGFNDGFVARISADGSQLYYGTTLGGVTGADGSWLVHTPADGVVAVGGATLAADFPVVNGAQAALAGTQDGTLTLMQTVPTAVVRYGAPTAGSAGYPTIHALDDAVPGNANFGIACSKVQPNTLGVLGISANAALGVPLFGANLLVDAGALAFAETVMSNGSGEHTITLPLPTAALGTVYVQYLWADDLVGLQFSASDGLRLF